MATTTARFVGSQKENKMKYEVSYVLPNGTKRVFGRIEKTEKGQYLASYLVSHGDPYLMTYETLEAAVSSYNLNLMLQVCGIAGFSVSKIE